jgi:site-specific DNA-methyltransferase (adenine-specific)
MIETYKIDESQQYQLYKGNCLDFLKQRKAESIDCIFADPPYFITGNDKHPSYKGDWDKSQGFEKDFQFHLDWIEACKRVLNPNGVIWITGTDHSIHDCAVALRKHGFKIINNIVWYKPRDKWKNTTNSLAYSHEVILFATKSSSSRPYINQKLLNTPQDKFHKEGCSMPTIWDIKPASFREVQGHKTPKPVELMKRALLLSTKENDIILDPFNGSGSTGVASLELNRRYIGVDLDRDNTYLALTVERLEEVKRKKAKNIYPNRANI